MKFASIFVVFAAVATVQGAPTAVVEDELGTEKGV